MSSLVARLSSTAALVLAAGLLAGAGPSDQPSADGRSPGARAPAVRGFAVDPNAPDENSVPADPAGRTALAAGRTAQSITPSPNFYYYRVLGTDFQPRTTASTFAYDGSGCVYQTGGTDFRYIAHVNLPEGAILKYVRLYSNDTSASNLRLWLTKYTPGVSSTDVTFVDSAGAAGYGTTLSPEIGGPLIGDPPAETVDNSAYSYTLIAGPTATGITQQFCGARIAYYYPADGHFTPIPPCRVVDTRGGAPLGGGFLPAATERDYKLTGLCGIPTGATSVSVNATVTGVAGSGFLSLWQQGAPYPTVSTLNFLLGETQVNAAIVPLSATGQIAVALGVSGGHVILDVNGYYY